MGAPGLWWRSADAAGCPPLPQERKLQARLEGGGAAAAPPAAVPGAEGGVEAGAGAEAAEEDASPFAAISATMGWDCFHWVTMLWILLR